MVVLESEDSHVGLLPPITHVKQNQNFVPVNIGVRQRGIIIDDEDTISSTPKFFTRPFKTKNMTALRACLVCVTQEVSWLVQQGETQRVLALLAINISVTVVLLALCRATKSLALLAYSYLSLFSILSLLTCLVCIWTGRQKATDKFTFGFLRCEALAGFMSVALTLFGALMVTKEGIERLLMPEQVHPSLLTIGGIVGVILHLSMSSLSANPPLTHMIRVSRSSILQEHVSDICHSLCGYIPALRPVLLPRVNPLVLISVAGYLSIVACEVLMQVYNYQVMDTVACLYIAALTVSTMFPLCVSAAHILLQTTPTAFVAQLDKSLREALTLDGVLEFRQEFFWTLGVGMTSRGLLPGDLSGVFLAGSLHVRVRRDANEQLVLRHVKERLSPLVPLVTVQVFKDDWTRSAMTLQLLNESAQVLRASRSPSPHYVNITYPNYIHAGVNVEGGHISPFPTRFQTPVPRIEQLGSRSFDTKTLGSSNPSLPGSFGWSVLSSNIASMMVTPSIRGMAPECHPNPDLPLHAPETLENCIPTRGRRIHSPHYVNVDFNKKNSDRSQKMDTSSDIVG